MICNRRDVENTRHLKALLFFNCCFAFIKIQHSKQRVRLNRYYIIVNTSCKQCKKFKQNKSEVEYSRREEPDISVLPTTRSVFSTNDSSPRYLLDVRLERYGLGVYSHLAQKCLPHACELRITCFRR